MTNLKLDWCFLYCFERGSLCTGHVVKFVELTHKLICTVFRQFFRFRDTS